MKNYTKIMLIALIGMIMITISCKEEIVAPSVTTNDAKEIKKTSAVAGGNITSDGGSKVIARGVCYSHTDANPKIETSSHTTDGIGIGTFESKITGLTTKKKCFFRAYATNSIGTSYGAVKDFTTL